MVIRQLWQNFRYSVRALRKNPGFTAVAILSLALGIGANVAIFTLINALLLRDLPVPHLERLVELSLVREGHKITFSYPMFRELDRGQRVFSAFVGWSGPWLSNVDVSGVLAQSRVYSATSNYYSELGAAPLLGRLLTSGDVNLHAGSTSQVAVIGYEFWQQRLGGARDAIGKQIRIEGQPVTIVGVTRKWFSGLTPGDVLAEQMCSRKSGGGANTHTTISPTNPIRFCRRKWDENGTVAIARSHSRARSYRKSHRGAFGDCKL
jgi:MacB-like periplasmic core domain